MSAIESHPSDKHTAVASYGRSHIRTILVAEDDTAMRELVTSTLTADGYDVIAVGTGDEAAKILEERSQRTTWSERPVDLLLTDLRMPGSTGLSLTSMVREAHWEIPVIVMTAFAEPNVIAETEHLQAALLSKPFRLGEMRRVVLCTLAAFAAWRRDREDRAGGTGAPFERALALTKTPPPPKK